MSQWKNLADRSGNQHFVRVLFVCIMFWSFSVSQAASLTPVSRLLDESLWYPVGCAARHSRERGPCGKGRATQETGGISPEDIPMSAPKYIFISLSSFFLLKRNEHLFSITKAFQPCFPSSSRFSLNEFSVEKQPYVWTYILQLCDCILSKMW